MQGKHFWELGTAFMLGMYLLVFLLYPFMFLVVALFTGPFAFSIGAKKEGGDRLYCNLAGIFGTLFWIVLILVAVSSIFFYDSYVLYLFNYLSKYNYGSGFSDISIRSQVYTTITWITWIARALGGLCTLGFLIFWLKR